MEEGLSPLLDTHILLTVPPLLGDMVTPSPLDLYGDPPPLSPSLGKGGGDNNKRGASPLLNSPPVSPSFKGEGGMDI